MKMQKLNSKQMPQVIVLGVLCAGVLGYGGYEFLGSSGGGAPANNTPSKAKPEGQTLAVAKTADAAAGANAPGSLPANITGMTLPGQFNPDPFRPSAHAVAKTVGASKPAAKPASTAKPETNSKPAPALPSAEPTRMAAAPSLSGFSAPSFSGSTAPSTAVPTGPVRPAVVVTGTSLCPGADTAIVEVGQEHRVLQVGDQVSVEYRVKKIEMDGIVLVSKSDRYFVGKGNKGKSEKPDAGGPRSAPAAAPPGVLTVSPR